MTSPKGSWASKVAGAAPAAAVVAAPRASSSGTASARPAASASGAHAAPCRDRFICVLDFEATCEKDVKLPDQEIIQFPSVLVRVSSSASGAVSGAVVSDLDQFVKPKARPSLSAFCTELTGITQAQVDAGVDITAALAIHRAWLMEQTGAATDAELAARVLVATCGDWDLQTMLPGQARREGLLVAPYMSTWCNVKFAYKSAYGSLPCGMTEMLDALGIPLVGRHHNGLDDCKNIAKIVLRMLADGKPVETTTKYRGAPLTGVAAPMPAAAASGGAAAGGGGARAPARGAGEHARRGAAAGGAGTASAAATAAAAPAPAVAVDTSVLPTDTFICVLDFEATCEKDTKLHDQEIIQFPSVLVRVRAPVTATGVPACAVISEFDQFVKPKARPRLTAFCTELTGITQDQVDAGVDIAVALKAHRTWLMEQTGCTTDAQLAARVLVATCGDWDLQTMLPGQARREGLVIPSYLATWHNVKVGYEFAYGTHARGMSDMLRRLGLRLDGRHHNGLDDCKNIAKIVVRILGDGKTVGATSLGRPRRS